MQRVALKGKIIIFESVSLSKIIYLSFLTIIPGNTVEKFIKIQKKNFYGSFQLLKSNIQQPVWISKM